MNLRAKKPEDKEIWEGTVDRLAWGGSGIGRHHDGRLLLLKASLALFPGEAVEALVSWKKSHGEGTVTRWITKSPSRVESICPVASQCGGCDLWESGYEVSNLKKLMVEDLLHRQLKTSVFEWFPAPSEAKRHRIQLHWDGILLGFFKAKSHTIVPITECWASAPSLSMAIPILREHLASGRLPSHPQRWDLNTSSYSNRVVAIDEGQVCFDLDTASLLFKEETIIETWRDISLAYPAGGFFQACPQWAFESFHTILESWGIQGDTLYDLYGGVGFFSALLKDKFKKFSLIEDSAMAVVCAKKNLSSLNLNHECLCLDAGLWVPPSTISREDVALIDPPRSGCPTEVIDGINHSNLETLIMIGCDGATWARDLKRLSAFQVKKIAAIDLFPNTHHVECLALLKRKS